MEKLKFFLQYLLAPVIIAIIGGLITYNLQSGQRWLEEMKFTEQIIKDAYDTSNASRGLAISLLIKPALKSNPEFADSLLKSISLFYSARVKEAARNGNVKAIQNIQSISEDIGGEVSKISAGIKGSGVINKVQQARQFENEGFQLLQQNKISDARASFANADNTYNGFHNAYEISRVLTNVEKGINTRPAETPKIIDSAKSLINSKYSWGKDKE